MIERFLKNIKIAVIDDERMLLSVLSSLMRQSHYDAEFFSNPLKAYEVIERHPDLYQLLILDIRMPKMDGITFAKMIREKCPDLPILFMTADPSDEVRERAESLGRVAFLEKPFPLEQTLKEVIPKFLGPAPENV